MRLGEVCFQLFVIDDASFFQIDKEHLAWLKAPLACHFAFFRRKNAHFGSHHHITFVGDVVAGRAEAVTVQCRTDLATVREGDGCGAIPRFHQGCVIFIESATVLIHQRIAGPGFRDQHHHRMRERIAGLHQQFERVVEACGIGLAFRDYWIDFFQIVAQKLRCHRALAGKHPVFVAALCVDLAIVADQAERMSQAPGRKSIG